MMMTGAQYRASLTDGRKVFIDGEQVEDLAAHPDLAIPLRLAAEGYDRFFEPGPDAVNPFLLPPTSADGLRGRGARYVDTLLHTTFTCCMSFQTAAGRIAEDRPQGREAIHAYLAHVRSTTCGSPNASPTPRATAPCRPASSRTPTPICGSSSAGRTASSSAAPSCTSLWPASAMSWRSCPPRP